MHHLKDITSCQHAGLWAYFKFKAAVNTAFSQHTLVQLTFFLFALDEIYGQVTHSENYNY